MVRKVKLAICTLNQWCLDFEGNHKRIAKSIKLARAEGASYRLGSELEITSYGCEDHYHENDTVLHSWQVLSELLKMEETKDMICDVGMPVLHNGVKYNCRIIFLYKKIILIRPKLALANDLNYRELRWFTPWFKRKTIEDHILPPCITNVTGQISVPFGDAIIHTKDTKIGCEICEELWTAEQTHVDQALAGVEVFTNSSGSCFSINKLNDRLQLVQTSTKRLGGVYLFCNQLGCDGGRLYFDGSSIVTLNGDIVVQGSQFSMKNVQVDVAIVDLDDVTTYRATKSSFSIMNSMEKKSYPMITLDDFTLCGGSGLDMETVSSTLIPKLYSREEEIAFGPACWLWDYLRRSGQSGFFLPLSGGMDSSSVACIVYSMCCMVCKEVENGNESILVDIRNIVGSSSYFPSSPESLCNKILTTAYMASENSSAVTQNRSHDLAQRISSNHIQVPIGTIVNAVVMVFTSVTGFIPKYKVRGGSNQENIALQNIQARIRMVLAYLFAQLIPWVQGKNGTLLVLGSSNVDEALRGYFTKYDCSSADINPIGGISKTDLRSFLLFALDFFKIEAIKEIVEAPPTAELEPLNDGEVVQTDEDDMGMTYKELSSFGKLRKVSKCGPYSMFIKLLDAWKTICTPSQIAQKVKHFFVSHVINRHKMTTLTPSMHAEAYSPDDNRFDMRPFLYNKNWTWQFREIDKKIKNLKEK